MATRKKNWHVSVAAEATAAAQLARCKWDVSVQYGPNQPEYDLMASKGDRMLKISVKGSSEGGWALTQNYLEKREAERDGPKTQLPPPDYRKAIDDWLADHSKHTLFFFVQFEGVAIDALPRCYVATPREVAEQLKCTAKGRGYTILYESISWGPRAHGAGTTDAIPDSWRFTEERLNQLADAIASS